MIFHKKETEKIELVARPGAHEKSAEESIGESCGKGESLGKKFYI